MFYYGTDWDSREDTYRPVPIGVKFFNCTNAFLAEKNGRYFTTSAAHCWQEHKGLTLEQPFGTEDNVIVDNSFVDGGPAGKTNPDVVDVSWAEITGVDFTTELLGLSAPVEGPAYSPDPGDELILLGWKSGVHRATVETTDETIEYVFQPENHNVNEEIRATLVGVGKTVDAATVDGDSGSAWVYEDSQGRYRPAGIHFGNFPDGSAFCDATVVERVTGLNFVTGEKTIGPDGIKDGGGQGTLSDAVNLGGENEITFRDKRW